MYSSQEMVLGAGAVSDCLLTGCQTGRKTTKHQAASSTVFQASTDGKSLLFRSHLKRVFGNAAAFAQALHHGFVPQDVLLAQVLPPLPGLQHQAVHRVEVCQEVPHALLEGEDGNAVQCEMPQSCQTMKC